MADETDTDDDAISFARVAFGSVSALELLILLRRGRHRSYRIDELVRELRSSELAVARALDHLMKFDLVEERPGSSYLYQQGSARLEFDLRARGVGLCAQAGRAGPRHAGGA